MGTKPPLPPPTFPLPIVLTAGAGYRQPLLTLHSYHGDQGIRERALRAALTDAYPIISSA